MLSTIVSAFTTACNSSNLNKTFVFGTISEHLSKPSVDANEIVFLQIPFRGNADASLLKYGSGNLGYSLDLYVCEKWNKSDQQAATLQAEWDVAMNSLLAVVNKVATLDRNLQRALVANTTHNEILRFGAQQYLTVRMTLNFQQIFKCS